MHPVPGQCSIVFGGPRSKVKVTEVKFDFFRKIAITSLILVVETNKNQNVQEDELYDHGMINGKYR